MQSDTKAMALFAYEISQMLAARSLECALASALSIVTHSPVSGEGEVLMSFCSWRGVFVLASLVHSGPCSPDSHGEGTCDFLTCVWNSFALDLSNQGPATLVLVSTCTILWHLQGICVLKSDL